MVHAPVCAKYHMSKINWQEVQDFYDSGKTIVECATDAIADK